MRIVICGGGGLGHTCSGVLSNNPGVTVDMLTNRPQMWSHEFTVNMPDGSKLTGNLDRISNDPAELIPQADIVFMCLPAYLVEDMVLRIRPYLDPKTITGSVVGNTGFFIHCHKHLPAGSKLFSFQRVPYVSRVVNYGHEENLLGFRDKLIMATENIGEKENFRSQVEGFFKEKTELAESFYEVTLSNSNPILHTGRIYSMWKDWKTGDVYSRIPFFYEEWTEEAAQLYISMDNELQALLDHLAVRKGSIPTVLDYYECTDASSLAHKLRSIKAFKGIMAPMKAVEGGFVPDFNDRYFSEDFPYGLSFACRIAKEHGVETPVMDKICQWGMEKIQNRL